MLDWFGHKQLVKLGRSVYSHLPILQQSLCTLNIIPAIPECKGNLIEYDKFCRSSLSYTRKSCHALATHAYENLKEDLSSGSTPGHPYMSYNCTYAFRENYAYVIGIYCALPKRMFHYTPGVVLTFFTKYAKWQWEKNKGLPYSHNGTLCIIGRCSALYMQRRKSWEKAITRTKLKLKWASAI